MGQYLRKLVLFAIVGVTVIDYVRDFCASMYENLVNIIFSQILYDTYFCCIVA